MVPDRRSNAQRHAREEQWRQLMRAAQEGDCGAYAMLLHDLLPRLHMIVQKRWRNASDVEDIVQDVLLSLHVARRTYDPRRPFVPWLMGLVRHRLLDWARRSHVRGRRETTVDLTHETFRETLTGDERNMGQEESDDAAEMRKALAKLSPENRKAIELTKLQGLSLADASMVTGKTVTALKSTVHRAIKKMRAALDREKE